MVRPQQATGTAVISMLAGDVNRALFWGVVMLTLGLLAPGFTVMLTTDEKPVVFVLSNAMASNA